MHQYHRECNTIEEHLKLNLQLKFGQLLMMIILNLGNMKNMRFSRFPAKVPLQLTYELQWNLCCEFISSNIMKSASMMKSADNNFVENAYYYQEY